MKRLLNLLTALSLLLCLAAVALWVGSYSSPLYVAREKLTTGGARGGSGLGSSGGHDAWAFPL